mgnify:FL=1
MIRTMQWVVLLLAATLWGCDSGYSEAPFVDGDSAQSVAYSRPDIGTPAQDFRLMDLDGTVHSLSQHQGKAVFLNF